MKCNLTYYYLRDGNLKMAKSMLQSLGAAAKANAGPLRAHTLGVAKTGPKTWMGVEARKAIELLREGIAERRLRSEKHFTLSMDIS